MYIEIALFIVSILLIIFSLRVIYLRFTISKLKIKLSTLRYWINSVDTENFRSHDIEYINRAREILNN
jgi:hypothetical protein